MNEPRRYSAADRVLMGLERGLSDLLRGRRTPAAQNESANLMRVNHAGEVAAQGLYHGQALTARSE
jgi:3-demethoxyubiquinol 3-hydroxylase